MKTRHTQGEFPAQYLVHWVTGTIPCCDEHSYQLVQIGKALGSVIPISENLDDSLQCENCKNESKKPIE